MSTPTHRAYTVIKREGKEDYWLNLGGHLVGSETTPMGLLATELGLGLITSLGSVTAVAIDGVVTRSSRPNGRALMGAPRSKRRRSSASSL